MALGSLLCHVRDDEDPLTSGTVADALRVLLARVRLDERHRLGRDDGIVVVRGRHSDSVFELGGYVWWIDQSVDPLWARIRLHENGSIAGYDLRHCVLPPLARELRDPTATPPLGRHIRRVLTAPSAEEIEKAWLSEQLVPSTFPWRFVYRYPSTSGHKIGRQTA